MFKDTHRGSICNSRKPQDMLSSEEWIWSKEESLWLCISFWTWTLGSSLAGYHENEAAYRIRDRPLISGWVTCVWDLVTKCHFQSSDGTLGVGEVPLARDRATRGGSRQGCWVGGQERTNNTGLFLAWLRASDFLQKARATFRRRQWPHLICIFKGSSSSDIREEITELQRPKLH